MAELSTSNRLRAEVDESKPAGDKKRVVVVGAGLIGTLTAYWLSRSGKYHVTCIDKGPAPASATSKANAGRFCPSLFGDLAPRLGSLSSLVWSNAGGGVGRVDWSTSVVSWGLQYIRACMNREKINATLVELGTISTRLTDYLIDNVAKIERVNSNIWVYDDGHSVENATKQLLASKGTRFAHLDPHRCVELTSLSKSVMGLTGGCLEVQSDFTADAREFTQKIAAECPKDSCRFIFRRRVDSLFLDEHSNLAGVQLDDGSIVPCDYMVLACGPWTNHFMQRWFKRTLPILPVRGASIELHGVKDRPQISVSDYTSGDTNFQVTPYGTDTLRLVGFADVVADPQPNDVDVDCPEKYRDILLNRIKKIMPELTWESQSPIWCGLRPITPDRLPIIGPSGVHPDVFLNVGHGPIGWTLAAASGYLLCNRMLVAHGHQPLGIDLEADLFDVDKSLSAERFGR